MNEDLRDALGRLIEAFDMQTGEYPSTTVYPAGEPVWGAVDDALAEALFEIQRLMEELEEEEV